MGGVNWINGYLLMYFFIVILDITADQFWLALSLMHGTTALLYFWRMQWLKSRVLSPATAMSLRTRVCDKRLWRRL